MLSFQNEPVSPSPLQMSEFWIFWTGFILFNQLICFISTNLPLDVKFDSWMGLPPERQLLDKGLQIITSYVKKDLL
jgi:hypothetical protein